MLLSKIKYNNFRPFLGEQEIIFDIDGEKNVTVILGDNTYGKSTLVLSFIWCLYGESRFKKSKDILNKKVERQVLNRECGPEKASVQIVFEDDNKKYTMTRTQQFSRGQNGKLYAEDSVASLDYVDEEGIAHKVGPLQSEINQTIKSILPKDLSEFFFFEGEQNNDLSKNDLSKAVKTLLGLEAYDKMRSHLHGSQDTPSDTSVMGQYLAKQNVQSSSLAHDEFVKKQKAEAEINRLIKENEGLDVNIDYYEKRIEEINEKLRQAAPSKEIQKRRDQIARELKDEEDELERNYKKIRKYFSQNCLPFFEMPLINKANDRLSEMRISDKGIKGIEAPAIRALLERKECLCGAELVPGTKAYENVYAYLEYIPPKDLGTLIRETREDLSGVTERGESFYEDFVEIYSSITKNKNKINRLESEDKSKFEELKEIGIVEVDEEESDLSSFKNRMKALEDQKKGNIASIGREETKKATAQANFNKYKEKTGAAKKYQVYYRYAEEIFNWVNDNYSEEEEKMRKRLGEYVEELFNNIYSGKRDISIDEKYNVHLTYQGEDVDLTGGLRVIQYFAYIGGLVRLANEIKNERSEEDGGVGNLGEEYPLVLDAAVSHADEKHTYNISKNLSEAVVQLVFAVMPKDWEHAKKGIGNRVNHIYELKKIDETEVRIMEVK